MLMHPFVKILYFILILVLISMVNSQLLFLFLLTLCLIVFILRIKSFLGMLKRMRWLFLSILVLYAFGTPGELVPQFPTNLAPSYEGIGLGLQQIGKLMIALAALSILLANSSREQLMLGLYMLLKPLEHLGLNVEKFAARLLLTLNYVEDMASEDNHQFSFRQLDEIHVDVESLPADGVVYFKKVPFRSIDKVMIFFALVLCVLMVFWSFA